MDVAVVKPNGRIANMIVVGTIEEAVSPDTLAAVSLVGDWRKLSYGGQSGLYPTPLSTVVRSFSERTGRNLYIGLD